MVDLTSKVYKGVKRFRRRRGYRRLASTTDELRSKRGRWSWIRLPKRLKIKLRCNPKKLFAKVHDTYVRLMMMVANSTAVRGGAIAGYSAGAEGICQFVTRPVKEYDQKMVIQMYKSLVMRPEQASAFQVKTPVQH
ncbi:hypothetical protein QVD17_15403 [Tagetes erecta]|uniref:Uncharacterized protein n=1 Tax=Tagetes erecta TaxID=13708 RepID=A0AAD8NZN1_TARER|nr:hypothetical protein QVD17_15403 [Tagetes erecta]